MDLVHGLGKASHLDSIGMRHEHIPASWCPLRLQNRYAAIASCASTFARTLSKERFDQRNG